MTLKRFFSSVSFPVVTLVVLATPAGAEDYAMRVDPNGDIGIGTESPVAPLHVKRDDGTARLLVQESSGALGTRNLLELENNGPSRYIWRNSNTGAQWIFVGPSQNGSFILTDSGDGVVEFVLEGTGNLILAGSLTTGGPTCNAGCDEVFSPATKVESIVEHAASMWESSYLPAVGATASTEPMNLSEKMGGVINELEKAHIYIERLHERLQTAQDEEGSKDVRIATLEQRLARLESMLTADRGTH